ncbi:hypothetical protein cand_025030 [Cryptosporidium andersoni]|uniref:Uncharacterized protein n=1 Tax=Cryptosporidium andersoni TaxID=117008 RepID=A0A1J4MAU0_9CRYT|nr:hypothetical protein cand_025030 [Cryptosporidium andersoni]
MDTSDQRVPIHKICQFLLHHFRGKLNRLYTQFYYGEQRKKYILYIGLPLALFLIRLRSENSMYCNIFIDNEILKHLDSNYSKVWKSGKKIYINEKHQVLDLKRLVFNSFSKRIGVKDIETHMNIKASCKGRVLLDKDNLALIIKGFCRRDPRIVFFNEST